MFSMETRKHHAEHKRMIWEPYSKTRILASEEIMHLYHGHYFTYLKPLLQEAVVGGRTLDGVDISWSWVMDFITVQLFGVDIFSEVLDQQHIREEFFQDLCVSLRGGFWSAQFPTLISVLKKIRLGLQPNPMNTATQKVESRVMSLCNAAEVPYSAGRLSKELPPNVYSRLRYQLEEQPTDSRSSIECKKDPSMLNRTIASEMMDHCVAGQESAGGALSLCLHYLSLNPSVQSRLTTELRTRLSGPDFLAQSLKELDTLPYLNAVILETLRLLNTNPDPTRLVPSTGCTLAGYPIPAGKSVFALAYVLHHDETVFQNADVFEPERWIEVNEVDKRRMEAQFWAFSSGDRQCIAKDFAPIGMSGASL